MTMTSTTDLDLLREFTRDQSQDAFTVLVQRHLNLVYCAALRQVRSRQLAEEVAQSVFTDLARNATRLKPDTILTAWLYQVTRREAIGVVRREARRRIAYPGLKAVDEFLTSNMSGRLQVIMSTIEPGGGTGADPYTHDSDEEVVVVLDGVLDLWVGDEHYVLREGDAITYPSRVPHWNVNHGTEPARVLFCITPPSF